MGSGIQVSWAMVDGFCNRSMSFDVLVGDSPTARMAVIGTVIDETTFLDATVRPPDILKHLWYAVRATDQDSGDIFYSPPQLAGCVWTMYDWRICREICRQERVRLIKGRAGSPGFLLKPLLQGTPCPCLDAGGKLIDPNCPGCYGQPITGGFQKPFKVYVDMRPDHAMRKLDSERGVIAETVSTWRVLAYPSFEPGDIWRDANTGICYKILGDIEVVAQRLSIPIITNVRVHNLDRGDPAYQFPITEYVDATQ